MGKIEELVEKYDGVVELPPNKGFKQKWFQKLIAKAGWYVGAPWCSFAVKVFWTELFGAEWAENVSGSSMKTYKNYENYQSKTPKPGGLVVWQRYKKGKPTWMGHIGLVTEVYGESTFRSMEGNTSARLVRDGQGIFVKEHRIAFLKQTELRERKKTGLVLKGFIDPPNVDFEEEKLEDCCCKCCPHYKG